jgi:hypothetical protein
MFVALQESEALGVFGQPFARVDQLSNKTGCATGTVGSNKPRYLGEIRNGSRG